MRNRVLISFAALGLLIILHHSIQAQDGDRLAALAVHDTYPTFSLALSSKSPEYRVGSDMWITIVQANLTNHEIDCTSEWDGIDRTFQYEATDEDGNPAERRHRGNPGFDVHGCSMLKGGAVPESILINRVFKFDRPGKYLIRVGRSEPFVKDEKGASPVVWSNPITITITG